jgi:predicted dienelactone hydrolase
MLLLLAWFACAPTDQDQGSTDVTDVTDVATDASDPSDEATDLPDLGPCEGADCLYRPAESYDVDEPTVVETITYTDLLGEPRAVPIAVYRPRGAAEPAPIVLLSHGGASGKDNPLNSMEHWAPVIARAGYVAVAIAHLGRSEESYDAACAEIGVQTNIECAIKVGWDRPNDTAAVLDWLESMEETQPGRLDLDRIYLIGHSAGAGNALMIAGAKRNYRCAQPLGHIDPDQACDPADLVSKADARVKAVVAMSPQGPDNEGFMETSFDTVDRPVLVGTGVADGEYDIGEPANRREVITHLPAGEKYELFLDDRGAVHTLFEGSTSECENFADAARCADMERWVQTTALAFLDAQAWSRPEAMAWLVSDRLVTAAAGDATWSRK